MALQFLSLCQNKILVGINNGREIWGYYCRRTKFRHNRGTCDLIAGTQRLTAVEIGWEGFTFKDNRILDSKRFRGISIGEVGLIGWEG